VRCARVLFFPSLSSLHPSILVALALARSLSLFRHLTLRNPSHGAKTETGFQLCHDSSVRKKNQCQYDRRKNINVCRLGGYLLSYSLAESMLRDVSHAIVERQEVSLESKRWARMEIILYLSIAILPSRSSLGLLPSASRTF
jgi:hypothetical protein